MRREDERKRLVGAIIAGSAVAVIAGLALYTYLDEDMRERVTGVVNREKVKAYVKHNIKDSSHLVDMVDDLSDTEINTLMKIVDKSSNVGKNVSEGFNTLVDRTKEIALNATQKVNDFID